MNPENLFEDSDVVYRYTRAQAIEDGNLVDVTEIARQAGFTMSVAVTRAVWEQWIVPPPAMAEEGQSESGRLWDVLNVLRFAIKRCSESADSVTFTVAFRNSESEKLTYADFKSVCGPGDDAEPVLTILLPDED